MQKQRGLRRGAEWAQSTNTLTESRVINSIPHRGVHSSNLEVVCRRGIRAFKLRELGLTFCESLEASLTINVHDILHRSRRYVKSI
jgi:hypothetical protein